MKTNALAVTTEVSACRSASSGKSGRRAGLASERGQAMLEAAFTLPLLLLVSISILEFGRAYQTAQIVTNAAREGARVAIVANTDDEDIQTRVTDYLESGQLVAPDEEVVGLEIEIDRDVPIEAGGATATGSRITVRYPFSFMVLNGIANLVVNGSTTGTPITITAVAQMRNEG